VTQTMSLSGEIFHPAVNTAIPDPFAKFEEHSFIRSRKLKEFKICRQTDVQTDRYGLQNNTRHGATPTS